MASSSNDDVESAIFGELSSNKKTKQKRNTWTFDETIRLIEVVGSTDVQQKLDGLVHNHKVWKDVAGALDARHSAEKCHDKWNYLKRKYREVKKNNNKSGRGRKSFIFFNEMDDILGHRPMMDKANHGHLDSASLATRSAAPMDSDSDGDIIGDIDEASQDELGSESASTDSSFVGNTDTTDEVQGPSQPPAPASQKAKKKTPFVKGKKNRGVSGALENAMSSLHELYDKMEARDERNLQKIEEREEQRRREDIDAQEKRHQWEYEQEQRRIKEHREFMMQMIQMMRQPMYPPNHQSPGNWSGPSYTSL